MADGFATAPPSVSVVGNARRLWSVRIDWAGRTRSWVVAMAGIEDQAAAALHIIGLVLTGLLGNRLWSLARVAGVDPPRRRAVMLFIASWFVLFAASVAFHLAPAGDVRTLLMALDQGAIFILIAAGWAPLAPFRMAPGKGRQMLVILWSLAGLGIAVELWAAVSEQHSRLHALGFGLYLLQAGLPILVFGRGLWRRLSRASLGWLAGSMIAYSIGLMFYQRTGMPWSHVAWHFAILVGCIGNFHGVRQLLREDAADARPMVPVVLVSAVRSAH